MCPLPGARLTLVSSASTTPYSGMLPGLIAGHYQPHETHVELRPLCRFAGAQFVQSPITGLDLEQRHILFRDRPPIGFDTLSINTGSTPALRSILGALTHGLAVKPVDRFLEGWSALRDHLALNPVPGRPARIVVVGGGAGGVELIFAIRRRLLVELTGTPGNSIPPEFHLVTSADVPLPSHGRTVQQLTARALHQQGIHVHSGCRVVEALATELVCAKGPRIPFDALAWAIHASAPAWVAASGLATDAAGFIAVAPTLQSTSHPFVFAAGDIATVLEHPRPKSGVFAVRQGPPLAENLRRTACGKVVKPFTPQSRALNLITTGSRHAIVSYGPLALAGRWVWTLKDWIDRRWMRGYQELPPMTTRHAGAADVRSAVEQDRAEDGTIAVPRTVEPTPSHPAPTPRSTGEESHGALRLQPHSRTSPSAPHRPCGGCAAKVPAEVLTRVLQRLQPKSRSGVLIGLDAPDDAAVVTPPPGLSLVQTVDSFRTFIEDPYLFGRIATLHGLNDLFAMGAEPHSALAVATLPFGSLHILEETLFQVLSGALAELDTHDTALIGGHSTEGPELALGLTLNGFVAPESLLRKSGLKPGDVLILTKAVGTGTLFAADMIGRAHGAWIEGAIGSMTLSGREAGRCFLRHHATACTDVSGFGLLGHLLEMLRASGASASLDLDSIPALEGALEAFRDGHLSSLHPQNRRASQALFEGGSTMESHRGYELLFDPQTSGGLLAGVPADQAGSCLSALHQAGFIHAAALGTVHARQEHVSAPWVHLREAAVRANETAREPRHGLPPHRSSETRAATRSDG